MRICLVYDCLFPWTVGGAERWYRNLAERLAADGHDVTYLTLRQWDRGAIRGELRACASSPPGRGWRLYGADGNRRVAPPLRFGRGVLWHLLRHGRYYDVVHTASFPYFSLLAAGAAAAACTATASSSTGTRSGRATYWREYLGRAGGRVGCARAGAVPARPAARVLLRPADRAPAARGGAARRRDGAARASTPGRSTPRRARRRPSRVVVFAGRHIPEKRAPAVVPAVGAGARARPGAARRDLRRRPGAPGGARGDRALGGSEDVVAAPGFVATEEVEHDAARARCAWCCRRAARATGWSSSRRRRAGRRPWSCATRQRRDRARRGRRQRRSSPRTRRRRSWPPRSCACARPARALRASTARLVRRQRRAAVAGQLARRGRRALRARRSRRASARRCAPR